MGFLNDYIFHASGHDAPKQFMIWSGLSVLGAVAGRSCGQKSGDYFTFYPNLYVCLVGTPGSGKSVALDQAEEAFVKNFPDYFVSESIQSREDIMKKMTLPQCMRNWTDVEGKFSPLPGTILDWRPFYCLVDEMENFVSVDQRNMVGLLVGIYHRDSFGTGFKNDLNPNQRIRNPYFSMLACTVPEWMMDSLRASLFVGGLGRRMCIVHSQKERETADPVHPPGAVEAKARYIDHLKAVEQFGGEMKKSVDAKKFYTDWFNNPKRKNKEDPILIQFHETLPVQVHKVAMLLALSEFPLSHTIEAAHIAGAVELLRSLDEDIVRLTSGIGRNELAGIGSQLLDYIQRMGGAVAETQVKKFFHRQLQSREFLELLQQYMDTKQLYVLSVPWEGGISRNIMMTPEYHDEWARKQAARFAANPNGSPPPSPA